MPILSSSIYPLFSDVVGIGFSPSRMKGDYGWLTICLNFTYRVSSIIFLKLLNQFVLIVFIPTDVLEIFHNLEAMSPLKAPGPDGYHSIFFQHHWDILSPNIVATIQEIFQTSEIPTKLGWHKSCSHS